MNWNPNDYAKSSFARLVWARELISRMAFTGWEAVLGVGCGDGRIAAEFARVVPRGFVLGVDNSPEFVGYASHHYSHPEFPRLQFQQMDALALWFERQFDFVFRYLRDHPPDSSGRTHVQMIRFEVEATRK